MSVAKVPVIVCVIDDDHIFTYGLKKLLEIKGFYTKTIDFGNGKDAIDYLTNPDYVNNLPDIILCDINMPVMDGWEFIQNFEEIKSQTGKKIALYVISSSADAVDIERAKNNPHITDYLLKPLDENYLTEIFKLLQHTKQAQSA
ncbi:response regulator [Mucilaginibacter segetis]|uniref:Response regulator n=1 Tax=Mucilaginibacter segetis TaxID=2793071 RepID=A0A934PW51_9SPHI|nr:response regulator [Mucilaginibacter segetis]MBK0380627.1 response regulator [Mucilaginibacter segetis]